MEWISVKDGIPEKESNFLGTDGELVFASYWDEEVGGWECCYYCGGSSNISFSEKNLSCKKITHWMPLPKLPEMRE